MANRKVDVSQHTFYVYLNIFYFLFIVVIPVLSTAYSADPNFYYYSSGRKNPLQLSTEMIALRFKQEVILEQRKAIVETEESLGVFSERKDITVFNLTLLPLQQDVEQENVIQTINKLNYKVEVEDAFPLFQSLGSELILTGEFVVKFKPSVSEEQIHSFNQLNNVEFVKTSPWTG